MKNQEQNEDCAIFKTHDGFRRGEDLTNITLFVCGGGGAKFKVERAVPL